MTRRSKIVAMTAVLCAVLATPSFARHQNHKNNSIVSIDKNANGIGEGYYAPQRAPCCNPGPGKYRKASRGQPAALAGSARNAVATGDRRTAQVQQWGGGVHAQILPHPAGCPSRRFCGCGTLQYLTGKVVTRGGLAIASNWLHLPRAAPGPGMAAARRGHVFAIVRYVGNNTVLAYDPNSGRGQTRLHIRSLRGYAVVNPHGHRYANAG